MLAYAARHVDTGHTESIRLMVADDNVRALALYEGLGFLGWAAPANSPWSSDPEPDAGNQLLVAGADLLRFRCLESVLSPLSTGEAPWPPSMVVVEPGRRTKSFQPRGGPRGNRHTSDGDVGEAGGATAGSARRAPRFKRGAATRTGSNPAARRQKRRADAASVGSQ